ncbi:SDR family oxidoreductase [Sphingomonas sp.]|uniref:SDR family oxidoreductase n=1 Tax=Sphingomonas sp. TaxID=28214 RepID=UPI0035BC28DE
MTDIMVALIGGGGVTGRPVIRAFQKRGVRVRALTSRADRPSAFPDHVEIRSANLLDVDSLAAGVESADTIHYIPPSFDPREEEYARNVIAAAERAGIPRIVYHSVLHAPTPDMPHHFRKSQVELLLRHSRLEWTVLQPAMYSQTALAFLDRDVGELTPAFDPTRPFTPIHDGDLGEAAAIVHTSGRHGFATYELAGTECLDFAAMGERLGALLGCTIATRKVPADVLARRLAAARRYTDEQVRELRLMFDHYDSYGLVGNGNVLRMILGREPTDFTGAMRESLAAR